MKIALTGDVALDLLAPYFRDAGFEVYVPSGFATWRQELLNRDSPLHHFAPDLIFDVTEYDEILAKETDGFFDERMRVLAKMPYSLDGIHALVREAQFASIASAKKVLALDADNTLWRGILSEDGRDKLEAAEVFQRGILALREKGVTLVLLTKNDPTENFFRDDMPLRDKDFAIRKINWSPKAGNLIDACRELNVGLDSVVFVDDNPFERAQMSASLPEVAIAPWNGWESRDFNREEAQLLRRLKTYFFRDMGLTKEDSLRAKDYSSPARIIANKFANANEYLASLDLRVVARDAREEDLSRLVQMAGKTNQFNATTLRRTRDEFVELLANREKKIFVFETRDKFCEQGIVCYVIVDVATKVATDFVMSCRAMGRTLEYFVWQFICRELNFEPAIDFVATAKNSPFKAFIASDKKSETFYKQL